MTGMPDIEQSYAGEVVRKGIHLCSLSIPLGYHYLEKSTTLSILLPVTAAFVLTDAARLFLPTVAALYHRFFGWLMRSHERDQAAPRLNGATYVLLSACFCIWIFPKTVAITAFAILIVSDTVAALVGRKYGKRPFLAKTLEGTSAFLVTAMVVVAVSPKVEALPAEYFIGFAGAIVGAVVEAVSTVIDDNLTIPLSIGGTMWLLYVIILPGVEVFSR